MTKTKKNAATPGRVLRHRGDIVGKTISKLFTSIFILAAMAPNVKVFGGIGWQGGAA